MYFFLLLLCWNSFIFSNSFDCILLKIATMPYMEVYYFFWCWDKYRRTLEMGSTSLGSLNEIDHHLSGCWGRQEKRPRNCRSFVQKLSYLRNGSPDYVTLNFFFEIPPFYSPFFWCPAYNVILSTNSEGNFFFMFRVPKRIHLYVCDQLFAAFFKKMHHSLHDVMCVAILILIL